MSELGRDTQPDAVTERAGAGPASRVTGASAAGEAALSKQDQVQAVLTLAALDSRLRQAEAQPQRQVDSLADQRAAVRKTLPPEVVALYDQALRSGREPLVTQLVADTCAGCYLRLATSIAQRVRRGRSLSACPHCGRLLYESASAEPVPSARRGRTRR